MSVLDAIALSSVVSSWPTPPEQSSRRELTPAELAAILRVTVWTANSRVLRARRRFRKLLAPYYLEYAPAANGDE